MKINYAVKQTIQPKLKKRYPNTKYVVWHVTSIDTSKVMVAKAGIRKSNDLVWIGRAANHAEKPSAMSVACPTWIAAKVHDAMLDQTKHSDGKDMWEQRKQTAQNNRRLYRSKYWWITK